MSKSSKGRTKPGRQTVKSKKKKQPQKVNLNKVTRDSDLGVFEALVLCNQATPDFNALEQRLIEKGLVAVNMQNAELVARFQNMMSIPEQPTIVVQTPGIGSYTVISSGEVISPLGMEAISSVSPFCQDVDQLFAAHRSTLTVVTRLKNVSPRDNFPLWVQTVQTILEDESSIGVVIQGALRPKSEFLQAAQAILEQHRPDFSAYVTVHLYSDSGAKDYSSIFTMGCRAFGLLELEMRHLTQGQLETAVPHLQAIANYCLWRQKSLANGEVIQVPGLPAYRAETALGTGEDKRPLTVLTQLASSEASN